MNIYPTLKEWQGVPPDIRIHILLNHGDKTGTFLNVEKEGTWEAIIEAAQAEKVQMDDVAISRAKREAEVHDTNIAKLLRLSPSDLIGNKTDGTLYVKTHVLDISLLDKRINDDERIQSLLEDAHKQCKARNEVRRAVVSPAK